MTYICGTANCISSHCVLLANIYYCQQFPHCSYRTITFTKSLAITQGAWADITGVKGMMPCVSALARIAAIIM
jgi:hypothetical protein